MDIDQLRKDLDTLSTQIAELQKAINSHLTTLREHEDDITALQDYVNIDEEGNPEDVDPEDAVDTDVSYPSVYTFTTPIQPAGSDSLSIPIRLKLDNQLSVDIEDVVLSARVTLRSGGIGQTFSISAADLSGDIEWYAYGANSFESWEDIKLEGDGRESYQLTYMAGITNTGSEPVDSIRISIRFNCEDYDIAK